MTSILRKVRKAKWLSDESLTWLPGDELQADALGDLRTTDNQLSVWLIDDNQGNLTQIVTALAVQCDSVANLDYILIDYGSLTHLNIKAEKIQGDTVYEQANQWHINLVELSATKLHQLAKEMQINSKPVRVQEKEVVKLIADAVLQEKVDLQKTRLKDRSKVIYEIEKRRV